MGSPCATAILGVGVLYISTSSAIANVVYGAVGAQQASHGQCEWLLIISFCCMSYSFYSSFVFSVSTSGACLCLEAKMVVGRHRRSRTKYEGRRQHFRYQPGRTSHLHPKPLH